MTQQFKPGDVCVVVGAANERTARNIGKQCEFVGYLYGVKHADCQIRTNEPMYGWRGQLEVVFPAGSLVDALAHTLRLLRDPDAELPAPPVEKESQT